MLRSLIPKLVMFFKLQTLLGTFILLTIETNIDILTIGTWFPFSQLREHDTKIQITNTDLYG